MESANRQKSENPNGHESSESEHKNIDDGEHAQKKQNHNNHARHDHSEHHKHMIKDFRKRFWISLIVTIPILVLSPMIQGIIGYELEFNFSNYLLFALSAFIFFYGGWPFLTGLADELKKKQPGMMTLIAVAITVAFGYSSATTFGLKGDTFFWELATLIDIMLLGHWIEMKSVVRASGALQSLVELMPTDAHLIDNKHPRNVQTEDLYSGDKVLVRPGEKIPVDGVIFEGESNINELMVTGESKPVKKSKDDKVIGGTLTKGNFGVTRYESLSNDFDDKQILRLAATLESESEHPLAEGILQKAKDEELEIGKVEDFNAITGQGIEGKADGKKFKIVKP